MNCLLRHIRKKEDGWNSFIAGMMAGATILFDERTRWMDIGLYTMARTVAALLELYVSKDSLLFKIHSKIIPLDLFLFCCFCSIIMYAFIYEPENMTPSYYNLFSKMQNTEEGNLEILRRWRLQFLRARRQDEKNTQQMRHSSSEQQCQ